ncbi:MAG: hypothetical protein HHJ12_17495 [Glaciimonas sp.]|nr:hypothetical protein [Glaciimonas sp.]
MRHYIPLKNGIPSRHDWQAICRHEQYNISGLFYPMVSTIYGSLVGQVVAIDGKTMRGTRHHRLGKKVIHMVSAFASDQGMGDRKDSYENGQ